MPESQYPLPSHFPLVERYMGIRLEAELRVLEAGTVEVIESHRRLRKEQNYGFLHALWWIRLEDGRSVASVPPGAGDAVRAVLEDVKDPGQLAFPTG